jgi:hypothetical protein
MRTNVILEKNEKRGKKKTDGIEIEIWFSKTKTYTHSHWAQVGAQLIFKRSSFKIEEKQETTNICCILRGYFLFHVVTMLNNNTTNKGFRYHVSLKVLSDMFFERKTRKFLEKEDYLLILTKKLSFYIMLQVVTSSCFFFLVTLISLIYELLKNLFSLKSE